MTNTYSVAVPGRIYAVGDRGYAAVELQESWPAVVVMLHDSAIALVIASGLDENPECSYCVSTSHEGETVVGWIRTEDLLPIEGVRYP